MAIQDAHEFIVPGVDLAARQQVEPAAKKARRLPVQKDWPTWAIVVTQLGILVGILGFWEFAARVGLIDAFFWSQPSSIYRTLIIFFTQGDAWTDISFTFRSTIFGFLIGTAAGSSVRPVVLVVPQLRGDRSALYHLL